MWLPRPFSALPPVISYEASPKAISRRTSYLRVRLEFLPYPQLIPAFFNRRLVRSSMNFYAHFNLAMDRSPGFGSALANYIALFRLAFASAPVLHTLTSLADATRRSVLQKVQGRASITLPLLVNIGFQVLFHSPPGVLFTFPSRYLFAIGHQVVFSLGGWSPLLPAGFPVSCGTLVPARCFRFSSTGLLPPLAGLSFPIRLNFSSASCRPTTPHAVAHGLGSSPFARRYWENRSFFLFLRVLRCFSSPGSLACDYVFITP